MNYKSTLGCQIAYMGVNNPLLTDLPQAGGSVTIKPIGQ